MESPRPGGAGRGLKNYDAPRGDRWDGATFAISLRPKQPSIAIDAPAELRVLLKIFGNK